MTPDRVLRPNAGGVRPRLPIVDALVLQQGPNYFLAKRLQHWRAMVAAADGHAVSSNVAPASNTTSVLKNQLLAAAYAGANSGIIPPLQIFDPETSNVLMTYLLLHDLYEHTRKAKGGVRSWTGTQESTLAEHPLNLFATTAVHNGIWRCAYTLRSLLEVVVAYFYMQKYKTAALYTSAIAVGAGAAFLRSRI
mmetsp:Transcript_29582/g.50965  ORF Transcript_29582/g.50965 Transcript_29582/m.50965 type:complete len:193 (-) Transcript_29582:69-647(-)